MGSTTMLEEWMAPNEKGGGRRLGINRSNAFVRHFNTALAFFYATAELDPDMMMAAMTGRRRGRTGAVGWWF